MMRRAIAKDIALLVRDRGALVSLFALPVVFMMAFGSVFSFGADARSDRTVAVWYPPNDPRGSELVRALAAVPGFAPSPRSSAADVRRAVAREDAAAGLVLPAQTDAPIELVIDLGAPLQVRVPIEKALESITTHALAPPAHPLAIETRSPPGIAPPIARLTSFQVTVPGNAVLFGFFITLTVAMTFCSERRSGTWRRLLAAPVPRWKALVATLLPYFLVGNAQLFFLFSIGALVFGMQIAGSVAALAAISVAVVICAVALGLLFAALGGSERQLGGIGSVVLLIMGLVGGCMVPRLAMPPFMKALGLAVPHSWALDGYYAVLVRNSTSLADVGPAIIALLAFAAGFATLGVSLFRFERS